MREARPEDPRPVQAAGEERAAAMIAAMILRWALVIVGLLAWVAVTWIFCAGVDTVVDWLERKWNEHKERP